MADAADSKSAGRKAVKVRLLSPAPNGSRTIWVLLRRDHCSLGSFVSPRYLPSLDSGQAEFGPRAPAMLTPARRLKCDSFRVARDTSAVRKGKQRKARSADREPHDYCGIPVL